MGVQWFPGAGYDPFLNNVELSIGAVLFETFLYGIYTVLFIICMSILVRRRHRIPWIFHVLAVAMYLLASAAIAYTMWLLFGNLLRGEPLYNLMRPKYLMFVTNNLFADMLLVYRCYIVWSYDKRILITSSFLLVALSVSGYVLEGSPSMPLAEHSWVYLLMTFVLNVILTVLTASRIWWFSRKANLMVNPGLMNRYNVTLRILIESGSIYCLYMVLVLALHTNRTIILEGGIIHVVGIVPTLILAQIGLGRTTQDAEAGSSVPRLYVGTDHTDTSKINFKPSTIRSTSSGTLSGANMTLDDSESRPDGSLGGKVLLNGKLSSPSLKDVQGQSHNRYDLEECRQVTEQLQAVEAVVTENYSPRFR